jgi:hypothetical protein
MGALINPYIYSVMIAGMIVLGLWLAVPLLFSIFTDSVGVWYPESIVILPLVLGGFVAARNMRSRYVTKYFFMDGLVGIPVTLFIFLVSEVIGELWLTISVIIAGGAISMFGSNPDGLRTRKYG